MTKIKLVNTSLMSESNNISWYKTFSRTWDARVRKTELLAVAHMSEFNLILKAIYKVGDMHLQCSRIQRDEWDLHMGLLSPCHPFRAQKMTADW